jgi:hypothetical protein
MTYLNRRFAAIVGVRAVTYAGYHQQLFVAKAFTRPAHIQPEHSLQRYWV